MNGQKDVQNLPVIRLDLEVRVEYKSSYFRVKLKRNKFGLVKTWPRPYLTWALQQVPFHILFEVPFGVPLQLPIQVPLKNTLEYPSKSPSKSSLNTPWNPVS